MELRSGDLRHQVTIRRATLAAEGSGFVQSWSTIGEPWAEVMGQDGREAVLEHALQGISVYRLRIRWRSDLKPSDQIVLPDGTELNLKSASDPDGRRVQLVIMADTESVVKS